MGISPSLSSYVHSKSLQLCSSGPASSRPALPLCADPLQLPSPKPQCTGWDPLPFSFLTPRSWLLREECPELGRDLGTCFLLCQGFWCSFPGHEDLLDLRLLLL